MSMIEAVRPSSRNERVDEGEETQMILLHVLISANSISRTFFPQLAKPGSIVRKRTDVEVAECLRGQSRDGIGKTSMWCCGLAKTFKNKRAFNVGKLQHHLRYSPIRLLFSRYEVLKIGLYMLKLQNGPEWSWYAGEFGIMGQVDALRNLTRDKTTV